MKILSIGNSFSQDAQSYLHRIANHDGVNLKTVNLYIGGCTLRQHYINMLEDNANYDFEFNGENTGIKVSIRQALASDNWDFITLQQASGYSVKYETFSPYIEALAKFVRKYCPHAKILIHQTWAYEAGSDKLKGLSDFSTPEEMMGSVRETYAKAAKEINADGIIPCGEAMLKATQMGIEKVHRDTFHASFGVGRYLLALCWYKTLTGADISNNTFNDLRAEVSEREREIAINAVNSIIKGEKSWK